MELIVVCLHEFMRDDEGRNAQSLVRQGLQRACDVQHPCLGVKSYSVSLLSVHVFMKVRGGIIHPGARREPSIITLIHNGAVMIFMFVVQELSC
ncbi:hypothetical protein [Verrucomicrobium sp. BvORR106]|uniref:hypothetical protein n=1 Tax=Verrucomicrobium sp. BvORR106 TaxID=1403819 RepID=UPI002240FE7F|nr:hypothetical protein [Verrucomicrobium sp. BvORR106]